MLLVQAAGRDSTTGMAKLVTDPSPLDELLANDNPQPLRLALGIMDEPRHHRQAVWGVDVSGAGGNIAIGGSPQTGKSTLLQTLILSAAATHSPRDGAFYGNTTMAVLPDGTFALRYARAPIG